MALDSPVERILSRLRDLKQTASGWQARCPAHDDGRASLSLGAGTDGRALVKCHAGCTAQAVCEAVGLTVRDLMPTADTLPRPARATGKTSPLAAPGRNGKPPKTYPTARDAIADLERTHGKPSATWTYRDAEGAPVGVVVRWDRPEGHKDIRPVSRHPDGWRIGGMPEPRPLYDLPALAGAARVVVCEGEKSADAVRSLGLIATTSPHGAASASKADWSPLAGKDALIWPDHDSAGRKYAEDVASILCRLDPPARVRMIHVETLADGRPMPRGGDAADWVAAGGTKDGLERLADAASEWTPPAGTKPGPILRCLADVEARPVAWLWPGRIPLGRITLLVGRPGEGKSFLTLDAAARVSTGSPWPDGAACPKGSVIVIAAEDDPADTIRPRLDAHGADVRRIHLLWGVRLADGERQYERLVTLADLPEIEDALARHPDCKLVIVDPIGSFLGGGTDAHRDNEVRSVLTPIARLAERHGAAVLVVAHRRKGAGAYADDLALGSRAFTGVARTVWHLSRDPNDEARRLFLPGKNNLAPEGDGLAFSMVGEPPRIAWERGAVHMTADDALAAEAQASRPGPAAEALASAREWLAEALADGPRQMRELFDEWTNGEGGSKRTLERAKGALGVVSFRETVPGPWLWRLPPPKTAKSPKSEELGDLGGLGKTPGNSPNSDAGKPKDAKLSALGGLGAQRERVTI
jgi:hypothetical protein